MAETSGHITQDYLSPNRGTRDGHCPLRIKLEFNTRHKLNGVEKMKPDS
jgi:hypothetical protein